MTTPQSGYRIVPLRDHNDMLVKAQFVVPDFKDGDRLCTRIKINLLYYQTNYFLFLIIWPYAFGAMFPEYYIYGMGAVVILPILLLVLAADNIRPLAVSSQTVGLCLGATWACFCWGLGLVASVAYFLVSVIVPLSAVLSHSAILVPREEMKQLQLYRSPMGAIVVLFTFMDDRVDLIKDVYSTTVSMIMSKFGNTLGHRRTGSGSPMQKDKKSTTKFLEAMNPKQKGSWGGMKKTKKSLDPEMSPKSSADSLNIEEEAKLINFPTGPLKKLDKWETTDVPEKDIEPEIVPEIVPIETLEDVSVPDVNYPLDSSRVKQRKNIFRRRKRTSSTGEAKDDKSPSRKDSDPGPSILKEEGKPVPEKRNVTFGLNNLKRKKKGSGGQGSDNRPDDTQTADIPPNDETPIVHNERETPKVVGDPPVLSDPAAPSGPPGPNGPPGPGN